MLERVRGLPAEVLSPEAYSDRFDADWDQIRDAFWKLERAQTFREPDHPAWKSWLAGDWDETITIFRARQPELEEFFRGLGFGFRRVRIIEFPVSPYLQWELNALKVHAEAGEQIRVVAAAKLAGLESDGPFPEVVALGTGAMYEILYDGTGTHTGARRFTRPDLIQACRAEIGTLFDQAEDLLPFFEREISPLPPPRPDRR